MQENMEKDEKIKILSKLADVYPEVRYVVGTIGEEQFLHMSYDVTINFASPREYVDTRTAELLATKHFDLCLADWLEFHPYYRGKTPPKVELGYAMITMACCLFEQALDEAWDGYVK